MIAGYFEQFNIINLISVRSLSDWVLVITNSSVIMILIIIIFLGLLKNINKLIPNKWQSLIELIYINIRLMVYENLGEKGQKFFPIILCIFIFIVLSNILGLFPFVFTPTSHIVVTFGMSLSILIAVILLGLKKFKLNFLSILMPGGVPIVLAPFLVIIETISFFIRAISLGVRLAANISAGHLLFAILSGFAFNMVINLSLLSIFPLTIIVFITLLEIMVSVIQAYVFVLLTTIYLSDIIALH